MELDTKSQDTKHDPMDIKAAEDEKLAEMLKAVKLPKREDYVAEQNTNGYGSEAWVYLNVFNLNLAKAPSRIFKYDLTFIVTKKRGDECTLHNALTRVDENTRAFKRNALSTLCRMMHEENKDMFRDQAIGDHMWRNCCAFDCGCSYYTGVELPNLNGEVSEAMWKSSGDVKCFVPSGKGPIKWNLTLVEVFPIDGENAKTQQALQFFDVLATQKLIRNEDIDFKPDAAYIVGGGDITRDQKELRKGIVTASKVIGDNICIQMDSKISMFFQEMPLLEYIRKFSNKFSESELQRFLFDKIGSRKLRGEMKNLPLRCRHIVSRRTFECKGFHKDNARDTTFTIKNEDGVEDIISVADYYEKAYKYRLKFPNLPLVLEKKGKNQSFHAIECLDIPGGIRVSNQKMSREAQENMIKQSCRAPAQLGKDMDMSRDVAGFDGTNKYLKAFNIKTMGEFAQINCKILSKPHIVGMGGIKPDVNERGQVSYTKGNFKFADPAKPHKPIALITLSNALREDDLRQIREELRRFGGDFGMQIEFANIRDPCLFGGEIEPLREYMASYKDKMSMFFFVTKEKMDESHNMVKKLEQELGVVTQCICAQTAGGILKRMRTTEYNVIAKMNQKLGGTIANPEVPPDLKLKNPDAYARAIKDWFKDRMFVGFTLSHAGSQSYADRLLGEEVREPTCVGMAFTLKHAGKRTAKSWFQEKRRATIEDITRHFVWALDVYAESNGRLPNSILIFRKGMSEGELKMAAIEVKQVLKAIEIVSKRPGLEMYRPTIQCLVCMANTSDRLFYQLGGDQNVPAGTCLDDKATNPDRVEFLIVPHNAIKGTSKAVRCTLVHDKQGRIGRKLELAELQSIFHAMCYINGVAASPTRLPVPLADSEKVAERQMNIFKEKMRYGDDTMSMCSGRSGGGIMHDGSADFYQKLSDEFAHRFKDIQYYA